MYITAIILRLFPNVGVAASRGEGHLIEESKILGSGKQCAVWPRGDNQDDTPNILEAFGRCDHGGTVVFPEDAKYWIGTRKWTNHAVGIVFLGSGLSIDRHDTGLINGNGDAWYSAEQSKTRPGRPMSFDL
ncbi:hypothetical protein DL763_005876 [Monosporascus cannonballus]|nr:hypothetical protein DL763_005876 [Monosporascus cannonballus]